MDAPKPQPRAKLIEARKQRKLSQKQVAERIGTTYVNVSRWERGLTRPGPYFQKQLSRLFGKTEEELDLAPGSDGMPALAGPSPANAPSHAAVSATTGERAPASSSISAATTGEAIYDSSIPPPPPVHIVGREDELARLRERLRAGENVAMTALHGLPGVGKTTLAITLAHDTEMRAHFRDGILWAALGPHPDISSILSHWSMLLGVATPDKKGESDHEALAVQLRRAIGTRRMLLVIDDAWDLKHALFFKIGGPNCAHLVTTRFPGIASAFAPEATSVIRELGENESILLLRTLAPQLMGRETQKVRELALAVGGLPLALTLLGNYLRLQAYSGQARRVDAALERLNDAGERLHINEPRSPAERHSSLQIDMPVSLQSVIDVTVRQLEQQAKAALYALSVFPPKPNHFSEEAALSVANCNVATLDALIDTGLLESAGESHYTLHQTIADYARTSLQDDVIPYGRLITYMAAFVERHRKDYEILESEYNSIISALESAYTLDEQLHKTKELMRCIYAFIPYLRSRGLYDQAEKQLQRAYAATTNMGDDDSKSQALLYLGEIAQKRGNYDQAETYLQDGLRLARKLGDEVQISDFLKLLGSVALYRGNYNKANEYLQSSLALARQIGQPEQMSNMFMFLGVTAGEQGNYTQAEEYFQEGLILARQIEDAEQMCVLLMNLGAIEGLQGNYSKAETYYREGLIQARRIGHLERISNLLSNLGDAVSEQENYEQAERYFQEGLAIARQIGHRELISLILLNIGVTLRKQGKYSQAENYFKEGLDLARQIGIPQIITNGLYEYGNLFYEQRQLEVALSTFHEILTINPEGEQDAVALAYYGMARIANLKGDKEEAYKLGESSVVMLETIGNRKSKEVRTWLFSIND